MLPTVERKNSHRIHKTVLLNLFITACYTPACVYDSTEILLLYSKHFKIGGICLVLKPLTKAQNDECYLMCLHVAQYLFFGVNIKLDCQLRSVCLSDGARPFSIWMFGIMSFVSCSYCLLRKTPKHRPWNPVCRCQQTRQCKVFLILVLPLVYHFFFLQMIYAMEEEI